MSFSDLEFFHACIAAPTYLFVDMLNSPIEIINFQVGSMHKQTWFQSLSVFCWVMGLQVLYSIVCKNHSKSIGIWRCWRGWKWWKPIQSTCLWTQPSSGSRQGRNVIFLYQFYIVQPSMLEPWVLVWVCVHTYCILRWVHPWL
jgi:hypothetical protein